MKNDNTPKAQTAQAVPPDHAGNSSPTAAPAWKANLHSWSAYAVATGATLALATNANAEIVYSGALNLTITAPASGTKKTYFSVGPKQFGIEISGDVGTTRRFGLAQFLPGTNKVGGKFVAILYNAGQVINGNSAESGPYNLRKASGPKTVAPTVTSGFFGPGIKNGFVGIKSTMGRLGWVQITVSDTNSDGYPDEAEVIDWAYNNTPDAPINAGDTGETTPEPGSMSLALLASGAAGLMTWRRRRESVIPQNRVEI